MTDRYTPAAKRQQRAPSQYWVQYVDGSAEPFTSTGYVVEGMGGALVIFNGRRPPTAIGPGQWHSIRLVEEPSPEP